MNAKDIREWPDSIGIHDYATDYCQFRMLQEIAAQLAESNLANAQGIHAICMELRGIKEVLLPPPPEDITMPKQTIVRRLSRESS